MFFIQINESKIEDLQLQLFFSIENISQQSKVDLKLKI
jgi:hypothetical protein